MTASELADWLLDLICADGQVQARSFADAAYTDTPAGVQLRLPSGAYVHVQAVTADPTGRVTRPDTGAPPPRTEPVALPTGGHTELRDVERYLAHVITGSRWPGLARVELFQHRRGRCAIHFGLTLHMHSGGRAWLYFRHITPAGRTPGAGPVWWVQGAV